MVERERARERKERERGEMGGWGRGGGEGEMLTWLDERFKRQHSEIQNAKSHSPETFVLPKDITLQAQAQAAVRRSSEIETPTPRRAAPRLAK